MITPGQYNIENLYVGASWDLLGILRDSTGTGINLTGYQLAASIWSNQRTTKYADFTIDVLNVTTGQIRLGLSDTTTASLPASEGRIGFWDLLLTEPSGRSYYWLRGDVFVKIGGSRRY